MDHIKKMVDKIVSDFTDECMRYIGKIEEEINKKTPPKIIYHYTNFDASALILKNKKIWFTDIYSLNDPKEVEYGLDCAYDALGKGVFDKIQDGVNYAGHIAKFLHVFDERIRKHPNKIANMQVCCFSTKMDHLSQWRVYGDNGRGLALGFDPHILTEEFKRTSEHNSFHINYDKEELIKHQRHIANLALKFIDDANVTLENGGANLTNALSGLQEIHGVIAMNIALFHKHSGYEDESEFRFLNIWSFNQHEEMRKALKSRMKSNGFFAQYIDFDWSKRPDALREIIVGPVICSQSGEFDKAKIHIENILRDNGFKDKDVEIKKSHIPYRG
jgi:hypothetical protein